MNRTECPVCSHHSPRHSSRCDACGADFSDPDVQAMMGQDASPLIAPHIAGGSLSHSKILGLSEDGLVDGSSVRKLALFGVLLLAAGFLLPVHHNFVDSNFAWSALKLASPFALLFPLLAIVMGLVAFFAPLAAWQRSTVLIVAGMCGLATLPFLGHFSGSPQTFLPMILLGTVVGGWGIILRNLDAQSNIARRLLVAGAVIGVAGFFIPMSGASHSLPIELRIFLQENLDSASPMGAYTEVFNRSPTVFFSVLYLLLPFVLLPAAAILGYAKPSGAWDKTGLILRPISWFLILYVPLGFLLFLGNLLGYESAQYIFIDGHSYHFDDFRSAAMTGRFRLLLLSAAFASWATIPIVAVVKHFIRDSEEEAKTGLVQAKASFSEDSQ